MTGYLFLAGAILGEVIATTFLKFTAGENARWWAWVIVVVGYVVSFSMLSLTLRAGVPLGIAYAIWCGAGIIVVALVSWLVFKESLTTVQLVGMALIVVGAVLLEIGAPHDTPTAS
jgi:small multidrug resistance pump